jgi:hypothetical protein
MSKNPIEWPGDLTPVAEAELWQLEGGMIMVGDGYCGTPYPWWPRPGVVDPGSIAVNPAAGVAIH